MRVRPAFHRRLFCTEIQRRQPACGLCGLFVGKNAKLRYSTIENWSKNMYNLNTKRALVEEGGTIEWVSGSFGSTFPTCTP